MSTLPLIIDPKDTVDPDSNRRMTSVLFHESDYDRIDELMSFFGVTTRKRVLVGCVRAVHRSVIENQGVVEPSSPCESVDVDMSREGGESRSVHRGLRIINGLG